jgi:hypothetical protein
METGEMKSMKFLLIDFNNHAVTALIRERDGMFLGTVMANVCVGGDDQNALSRRLFIDHDAAIIYLKENVAKRHADAEGFSFFEFEQKDGDSRIVSPETGSGRPH